MLNTAQKLYQAWVGLLAEPAPRAPKPMLTGTPERSRITRKNRFAIAWNDDGDVIRVRLPRLFKGHRV